MNLLDVAILLAVGAALALAVRAMRRGAGRCGGGCAGCPHAGACHAAPRDPQGREDSTCPNRSRP